MAELLDGEDPAHPDTRSVIDDVRETLGAVHKLAGALGEPFDLPGVSDEDRVRARAMFAEALAQGL